MGYNATFTKYPVAGVSKLLATNYGAHVFNVIPEDTLWNGALVKKGEMVAFNDYEEDEATEINAKIVWQASNGNFYVEVLEDTDVLLVYNVPVLPFGDKTRDAEKNFCIKAADGEIARAHQLKAGDIFELSAEGFDGTPVVGATISEISGKKPVVASTSI